MMALVCCLINSAVILAFFWRAPSNPSSPHSPVIAIFDNPGCVGEAEIHTIVPNLTNKAPSGRCTRYMDHWASWKCDSRNRDRLDSHSLWLYAYEGQVDCYGPPTRVDSWATQVCIPRGSKSVVYACSSSELSNFDFAPEEESPNVNVELDSSLDCDESGCPIGIPQRLMYASDSCSGKPLHRSLPFGKTVVDECYYDTESTSNIAVYCNESMTVDHSLNSCNETSSFVWKRETYALGKCFPITPNGYSFTYACESTRNLKEDDPMPVEELEELDESYKEYVNG